MEDIKYITEQDLTEEYIKEQDTGSGSGSGYCY